MQATLSKDIVRNIVADITKGVFTQPDNITTEYYAEDSVEVRVGVDYYCNLLEFSVTITDDNGNEHSLDREQYNWLCYEMECELQAYLKEAREEYEHLNHLAYA